MKVLGMIGGTGPESTIDYYRTIIEEYKSRFPDGGIPPLLINSINYQRLMDHLEPPDWQGMARMLAGEFQKLKSAGADFGLISANTPHICFEHLEPISPIPLLDIVACALRVCAGFKRVGLLGTKLTMESDFYSRQFERSGIDVVVPDEDDRDWVNRKYFDELFEGVFLPETLARFEELILKMAQQDRIEAVVLGGTELPLLLRDAHLAVPFIDTAKQHCFCALELILSD